MVMMMMMMMMMMMLMMALSTCLTVCLFINVYRWFTGHFHANAYADVGPLQIVITNASGTHIKQLDEWDYANVSWSSFVEMELPTLPIYE